MRLAMWALHVLVEVALVALGQVEDVEAADMHRHLGRFEMQEGGIDAAQVLHVEALPEARAGQDGADRVAWRFRIFADAPPYSTSQAHGINF